MKRDNMETLTSDTEKNRWKLYKKLEIARILPKWNELDDKLQDYFKKLAITIFLDRTYASAKAKRKVMESSELTKLEVPTKKLTALEKALKVIENLPNFQKLDDKLKEAKRQQIAELYEI